MRMKKLSWIFFALLLIVLALAGVLWSQQSSPAPEASNETALTEEETEAAEELIDEILDPVALPDIEPTESAVENVPELNPVEKTNPFNDGYKNPFGSN